jgi:hypothetical protein
MHAELRGFLENEPLTVNAECLNFMKQNQLLENMVQ